MRVGRVVRGFATSAVGRRVFVVANIQNSKGAMVVARVSRGLERGSS